MFLQLKSDASFCDVTTNGGVALTVLVQSTVCLDFIQKKKQNKYLCDKWASAFCWWLTQFLTDCVDILLKN